MRSFIVGTAGHIDHGKSALVRALTGTDPDRLKEEKERGITIDLGFAHLDLGDSVVASFIDVPGHERFVRNMLAGAHGIDAVLLVVAADESVMPQTREHFHICRLLGIPRGLIVLTKCDLADGDSQELAEMECRELVAGSFLEDAAVLRVSSRTGEGLEALRQALKDLASALPPRPGGGLLRLPVDRAFTVRGFGTVVTGTLVSGSLAAGEELEVLPGGARGRVRGLEVHGQGVDRVPAGSRAAVNLAGLDVADVRRGVVLARPGTLRATSMMDVAVTLLPGAPPLKDQGRLRVHLGSAEVLARVRLLEAPTLAPGSAGLAQLRLEGAAVAGRGDRLVLRSYSPAETVGGAVVLDPLPPKRRGRDAGHPARLRSLAGASPVRAATLYLEEAAERGLDAATLGARVSEPLASLLPALTADPGAVSLSGEPPSFVARTALEALKDGTREVLGRFHELNPLKDSMTREELRGRVFARAPAGAFEAALQGLQGDGEIRLTSDAVALARHAVRMTPAEEAGRRAILEAALGAGLQGLEGTQGIAQMGHDPRLLERISRMLVSEGLLCRVGEALLLHRDRLEALKRDVRARWPPGSRLDVTGFKDLTGLSRKFVIPLLEYLDRERVTRRSGNDRLVLM